MVQRWRKHGGRAVALPGEDRDATGLTWTSLAENPLGREACGWAEAKPSSQVTMRQARSAMRELGMEAEVDAWVADQDADIQMAWRGDDMLRRDAPLLLQVAVAKDYPADLIDDLFFAAEAVTDPTRKVPL
ncbi:MAG: hypothetical protein AB1942_21140 [Pseudomonadota bacterium]